MPNGERLRDAATNSMTDDARSPNAKLVEQLDDAIRVRENVDGMSEWPVAPSVAEQVGDDNAMSAGHERNDVVPQMARGGEAVEEEHGLARAAIPRGVVIETRVVKVEELTAHARSDSSAWGRKVARIAPTTQRGPSRDVTALVDFLQSSVSAFETALMLGSVRG
jgi:hypothetical protein